MKLQPCTQYTSVSRNKPFISVPGISCSVSRLHSHRTTCKTSTTVIGGTIGGSNSRRDGGSNSRRELLKPPAAAATLSYDSYNNSYLRDSRTADATAEPVAPLPTPPTSSSDWSVLPYLWKLALAEKQMAWRIGAAFTCMLMSKAAGVGHVHLERQCCPLLRNVAWSLWPPFNTTSITTCG